MNLHKSLQDDTAQMKLFPLSKNFKDISSSTNKARRIVLRDIPKRRNFFDQMANLKARKLALKSLSLCLVVFITCHPQKEIVKIENMKIVVGKKML